MPSGRQAGAYPSLIPGNQEGARPGQEHKPWDVIELAPGADLAGRQGASTSKGSRILKIPTPVMQADWYIRYHELTHVERPHFEEGPNKLRNLMRAMLEEVALDGQSLHRDGLDLRSARDFYDWSKYTRPDNVYKAAAVFFQLYTSAQVSTDKALQDLWAEVTNTLSRLDPNDPTGHDLIDNLQLAAEQVFADYSSGNCEDWADIVTAKLLGVPKEEIPDAPEPKTGSGPVCGPTGPGGSDPGESGASTEETEDPGEGDEPGGTAVSQPESPGSTGEDDTTSDGDDSGAADGESAGDCPACNGEGVDEDGEDCAECGGTGGAGPLEGGEDDLDGESSGHAGASGEGEADPGTEGGHSEWDDAPVPLDKDRQNDPMDFGFDPLGKTEGINPHEMPPEKNWKERQVLTKEQLQEQIDRDRVNRKAGESSQSEELTARTPHGAVDVHRHTLNRSTSTSVALGWRSSENGATVRYPSQMYPSGRVFAKKAPGGTIILDGSGSMDWHTQHIVQAQKAMPNLYVAVYSYHGSNGFWRASKGHVAEDTFIARYCIVAQKGKLDPDGIYTRNDELSHDGQRSLHTGGNSGADPAALWYAARNAPKPIVWVSDGMVSFGEDQAFWKQCDAIMRQHKIVRVLTIEDAIDYLLGKAVPGWHQCGTVDVRWCRLGQPMHQTPKDPQDTYNEADRWTRLRSSSRKR